jgi:hypothetical protein
MPEFGNFVNDPLQPTSSLMATQIHRFFGIQGVVCGISYLLSLVLIAFFVFPWTCLGMM